MAPESSAMLSAHVAEALSNSRKRIVVTGAGGWLGLATLDLLQNALGTTFESRVLCFGSRQRVLSLGNGTMIEQRPLADIARLASAPTLVLHLAFLTKDRAETMDEEAYKSANRLLSAMVLEALDPIGAEAVFVASSGAARFADDPSRSAAMRLYGALKRDDEEAFAAWAERQDKRAVIARIFNISGPHINKHGSYALACFILDALAGRPICVRAPHRVVRGYVAIRELMSLVFALLLNGSKEVTRFASGGEPMEMQAIAETVAELLGPVAVDRPSPSNGRADDYSGDDAAYRRLLAEHGIDPVSFVQQVTETAAYLGSETIESR